MFLVVSPAVCTWLMRLLLLQLLWIITKGIDLPTPPTNVKLSEITCTSAMVSWDEATGIIEYNVEWAGLLNDEETIGSENITGQHHFMLENLTSSDDNITNNYTVKVSAIREGVKGNSTDVIFSTHCHGMQNAIGNGSFDTDHLLASTISFIPVAPMNLSYAVVSNHTFLVSWKYPPSLIKKITSFEVTYNLVSAYNTSAGMKSFAEYDEFNTTQTSFHFALVSSVTNYIFTITPYSATHAGDSARVLVDDFSEVDLVEDHVIFFNLRISSHTANSLSSSDINKINSDLTRHMQSSINDSYECTLPSYTLKGSVDSCDRSQSNCAIYTGRLLGSDTASATKVFEMVEEWLATQNGSLLNGTLSVDPNCSLRLLSPSDTACSSPNNDNTTVDNNSSTEENEPGSNGLFTDGIKMLAIGFAGGLGIIICLVCTCACLLKLCKMKKKKPNALTYSENQARLTPFLQTDADAQRHYSVVVEHNPCYDRHHKNAIKPFYTPNGRTSSTGSLSSESPYSYTSLKTAQRQANAVTFEQQEDGAIIHEPVEQLQRHASESSTNQYVVNSLSSSSDYFNEGHASIFHPSSTPNNHVSYLSIS